MTFAPIPKLSPFEQAQKRQDADSAIAETALVLLRKLLTADHMHFAIHRNQLTVDVIVELSDAELQLVDAITNGEVG